MKQTTPFLIAGAILASVATAQAAVTVNLNGQPLATSAQPLQMNGTTLLPLRDVFEALGATVNWNPQSQTISAQSGTTQIQLGINSPTAYVNGRAVTLSQPAILNGGSAFVPLRFVAEATGAQVSWNGTLQQVSIQQAPVQTGPRYPVPVGNAPYTNVPPGALPAYQAPPAVPNAGTQIAAYRDIAVPANVVIPVRLDSALSSKTTRVGDIFTASVASNRLGDSEFPAGTKIEGQVVEARAAQNGEPGVLDLNFRTAIFPDGTRVPLRGDLSSLDAKNVSQQGGRLVAAGAKKSNDLKIIGIGAGAGFVLGKLLKTNSTISTILGAGGGYLFSKSREKKAQEATLAVNSTLGVRLQDSMRYVDTNNYSQLRDDYLRNTNANYAASDYGYDDRVSANPDDDYDGYNVSQTQPADSDYADYTPLDNDLRDDTARARPISIPAGAVVPVTLDKAISSATARVGDQITATVASQRLGDSEFPAGTRIIGRVIEASPKKGDQPGVLDFEFRTALLPDGRRAPLAGQLITLDKDSVQTQDGRIVAKAGSKNDRLKVIGVGAGAGYVIGRLLKKDGLLSAAIGALGGLVLDQSKNKNAAEAVVPAGAKIGVKLDDRVTYNDKSYYASRDEYLRLN